MKQCCRTSVRVSREGVSFAEAVLKWLEPPVADYFDQINL